jgi:hypothetical protein
VGLKSISTIKEEDTIDQREPEDFDGVPINIRGLTKLLEGAMNSDGVKKHRRSQKTCRSVFRSP